MKDFCRGQRFRPNNDPYFKLLRAVGQQTNSVVDLNELANAHPDVRGSINNIKERRLAVLLQSKPTCAKYFYYNQDSKNFAIEDPALFYFVKHVDWSTVRSDCGFRETTSSYEYDIALSFAGANRELAKHIADQLEILDVAVFYDALFEANFLGRAWSKQFDYIFRDASRLVVCILDSNHRDRIWPTFERECFEPRVANAEVIPVFLDATVFPGIPQDIVGIRFRWDQSSPNWNAEVDTQIVFKIIERLSS